MASAFCTMPLPTFPPCFVNSRPGGGAVKGKYQDSDGGAEGAASSAPNCLSPHLLLTEG